MSTTTVFKGDIQFKVGEEEIKCSELATIDDVNKALEEIGNQTTDNNNMWKIDEEDEGLIVPKSNTIEELGINWISVNGMTFNNKAITTFVRSGTDVTSYDDNMLLSGFRVFNMIHSKFNEVNNKLPNYITKTECDEKYALKTAIPTSTHITGTILNIQSTTFTNYKTDTSSIPSGYEYAGFTTDWFPRLDYTDSNLYNARVQFKVDTTNEGVSGFNGGNGIIISVRTINTVSNPSDCSLFDIKNLLQTHTKDEILFEWYKIANCAYSTDTHGCYQEMKDNSNFYWVGTNSSVRWTWHSNASYSITSKTSDNKYYFNGMYHNNMSVDYNIPKDTETSDSLYNKMLNSITWYFNTSGFDCGNIKYKFVYK